MKLKEVLINLLSNAVKYTPENGKISFTAEQVTKYQDMCTLRFIVRDNGIGISEEYLPKLFEAFSQEAEDGSNQYGSTGLGMAITKSLVQLMNGEISVTSKKGKGSNYDAILMDIRMPVMDGLEATKSIRALERADAKTVQIIAMSANAFAEDIQRSLQAGMNAHLSKPVDMNLLFETLGKVAANEPLK